MATEGWIKPLAIKHSLAMQILGIGPSKYWKEVRDRLIKTVGHGVGSRADYASIEAYHAARLAAPKKTLKMNDQCKARAAANAAERATEEIAAE
jgi:hypothetical protein